MDRSGVIESALLAAAVVISLVAAWLLYRLVEAPTQAMSRNVTRL